MDNNNFNNGYPQQPADQNYNQAYNANDNYNNQAYTPYTDNSTYQAAPAPQEKKSTKELVAMICGFAAVGLGLVGCCCNLLSILAIAAGIVSLVFYKKISNETGSKPQGADLAAWICAIVGISFGGINAVILIISLFIQGGSLATSIINSMKYRY